MPSCRIVEFSALTAAQSSGSIVAPVDLRIHVCPRNERCQRRRTPRRTREALTLQQFQSRHYNAFLLSIFWCLHVLPVGAVDSVVVGTVTTLAGGGPAGTQTGLVQTRSSTRPYGVMLDQIRDLCTHPGFLQSRGQVPRRCPVRQRHDGRRQQRCHWVI